MLIWECRLKVSIEFDIVGLFDNINHEKLLELVEKHYQEKWVLMYAARYLKAPIVMQEEVKALQERKVDAYMSAASIFFKNSYSVSPASSAASD